MFRLQQLMLDMVIGGNIFNIEGLKLDMWKSNSTEEKMATDSRGISR